jgi:hypothetical protein
VEKAANGTSSAMVARFMVTLHPQSKQRWSVNLTFIETG